MPKSRSNRDAGLVIDAPSPTAAPPKKVLLTPSNARKRRKGSDATEAVHTDEKVETQQPVESPKVATPTTTLSKTKTKSSSKGKRSSQKKKGKQSNDNSNNDSKVMDVEVTPLVSENEALKKAPETTVPAAKDIDVIVHRLRYMQYRPRTIICLQAVPSFVNHNHNNNHTGQHACVIACKDNGAMEMRQVFPKSRILATIAGSQKLPIRSLAYVCGQQCMPASTGIGTKEASTRTKSLFSSTLVGGSANGNLCIVDFVREQLTGLTTCGGGGVFAVESFCLPGGCRHGACKNLVAVGSEDGSIRLFKVVANESLELVSTVPTAGAPIISLTVRMIDLQDDNGTVVFVMFAGVADGTIRRYDGQVDSASGRFSWQSTLRMTIETNSTGEPTRVWTIKVLSDGSVVTGTSLGHVQIWDGDAGTLQQSFEQNDNNADVLCCSVTFDESKIYASGVDSRVICIERSSADNRDEEVSRWVQTSAQRPHSHDVNAMCIASNISHNQNDDDDNEQKPCEILCTGGIDTKICTYSVHGVSYSRPKSILPWPDVSPMVLAPEARLLAMLRGDTVDFYKLSPGNTLTQTDPLRVDEGNTLIGTLAIHDVATNNLKCIAINQTGSMVAFSSDTTLYVFNIVAKLEQKVSFQRIVHTSALKYQSISALGFNSSNILVCAARNDKIFGLQLGEGLPKNGDPDLIFEASMSRDDKMKDVTLFSTRNIVFSPDDNYFAVSKSDYGCISQVDLFKLVGDEQEYSSWWSVPCFDRAISVVSFLYGDKNRLAVAFTTFALTILDVELRKLDPWSAETGLSNTKAFPYELTTRDDYPVRICLNRQNPTKVILGSFGVFAVFNIQQDMPTYCRYFPQKHVRGQKRKRSGSLLHRKDHDGQEASCHLCLSYNSVLFMEQLTGEEMVVVEQPWLSVVATFPDAIDRRIYAS